MLNKNIENNMKAQENHNKKHDHVNGNHGHGHGHGHGTGTTSGKIKSLKTTPAIYSKQGSIFAGSLENSSRKHPANVLLGR